MDNDYTQITWPEVRQGDVLMHANGDRLTVESVSLTEQSTEVYALGRWRSGTGLGNFGFFPYRRKPEIPTVPGAYLDKDGVVWELASSEPWSWSCGGDMRSARYAARFAPFTRLVPMPTEEQIVEVLDSALDTPRGMEELAAAVLALLTGKEADNA